MKLIIPSLLLFGCVLAWAFPVEAATYTADSCSQADVAAKVALATDDDTVNIPACSQTNWTTKLSISKGIILKGAGQGVTIIGDNVTKGPCTGPHDPFIAWTVNRPHTFQMSDMTVVGVATDPNKCLPGHITINGTSTAFRIHHMTFNPLQSSAIQVVGGQLYGLIDHLTTTANDQTVVIIRHTGWGGSNYGDGSWAAPLVWGGGNVIVLEDNTASDSSSAQHGFADCFAGGRYVSRHNHLTNYDVAGSHGADSSQRFRGCRQIEAYENDANWTISGVERGQQTRGGTSVVYNNRITTTGSGLSGGMVKALEFRDVTSYVPWGQCDGTGGYDGNTTSDFDTNGNSHGGYRCIDQPGAGTSDDLAGTGNASGTVPPTPVGSVHNASDPIYVWGNTFNGASNNTVLGIKSGGYSHVVSGRDYINNGTTRPGYTAYTYPHPLQGTIPLTTPANGPEDIRRVRATRSDVSE